MKQEIKVDDWVWAPFLNHHAKVVKVLKEWERSIRYTLEIQSENENFQVEQYTVHRIGNTDEELFVFLLSSVESRPTDECDPFHG